MRLAGWAAALALLCLIGAGDALATSWEGRQLLQGPVPTNCTAPGDSWGRAAFNCTIPPSSAAQCAVPPPPAPPGTVQCLVVNVDKPNVRTGATCPVRECRAVCELVVMQNFFPPDVVFAVAELLAAWKPAVAGC